LKKEKKAESQQKKEKNSASQQKEKKNTGSTKPNEPWKALKLLIQGEEEKEQKQQPDEKAQNTDIELQVQNKLVTGDQDAKLQKPQNQEQQLHVVSNNTKRSKCDCRAYCIACRTCCNSCIEEICEVIMSLICCFSWCHIPCISKICEFTLCGTKIWDILTYFMGSFDKLFLIFFQMLLILTAAIAQLSISSMCSCRRITNWGTQWWASSFCEDNHAKSAIITYIVLGCVGGTFLLVWITNLFAKCLQFYAKQKYDDQFKKIEVESKLLTQLSNLIEKKLKNNKINNEDDKLPSEKEIKSDLLKEIKNIIEEYESTSSTKTNNKNNCFISCLKSCYVTVKDWRNELIENELYCICKHEIIRNSICCCCFGFRKFFCLDCKNLCKCCRKCNCCNDPFEDNIKKKKEPLIDNANNNSDLWEILVDANEIYETYDLWLDKKTKKNGQTKNKENEQTDKGNEQVENKGNEQVDNKENEENKENEQVDNKGNEQVDTKENEENKGNEQVDNKGNEQIENKGNEQAENKGNEQPEINGNKQETKKDQVNTIDGQYAVEKTISKKGLDRIIEKTYFAYRNDFSHLHDIVRASLIFKTMTDLILAFVYINIFDDEVKVTKIKNRFDPNLLSWATGGYRDVLMNIRFNDGPIIELQLQLNSFYKLKEKHHVDYKVLREIQKK